MHYKNFRFFRSSTIDNFFLLKCGLSVKLPATVRRSHSHFCLRGINLQLHSFCSVQGTTIGPASCHSKLGVKKKKKVSLTAYRMSQIVADKTKSARAHRRASRSCRAHSCPQESEKTKIHRPKLGCIGGRQKHTCLLLRSRLLCLLFSVYFPNARQLPCDKYTHTAQ